MRRWVLAALSGLPPVSELDGAHVRRLARLAARWQAQLMRVQVQARQEEQEEGQRKQQAESSANVADSASDVSEASTPASTTASSPSPSPAVVAHVLQQLDALPRRVREKLPAFTASDCAAVLQDLALLHPRLCKLEADVHELLATQVGMQTKGPGSGRNTRGARTGIEPTSRPAPACPQRCPPHAASAASNIAARATLPRPTLPPPESPNAGFMCAGVDYNLSPEPA